jgi:hypothetical protein
LAVLFDDALTASQGILENLFEAQELQDRQVHCWMETETTLIWTKRGVELDSIATVHLHFAFVVLPCNTELDHAFWNRCDFESLLEFGVLLEEA